MFCSLIFGKGRKKHKSFSYAARHFSPERLDKIFSNLVESCAPAWPDLNNTMISHFFNGPGVTQSPCY